MSSREGQVFGNYQAITCLGTGGMGAVYLAEHTLIGKRVALKIIHQELSANQEVISRFFNEARAVNQIGNEHIVEIHDVGATQAGEHYFVMEYIHGRTLSELLAQRGALPVPQVLRIAVQIASALESAHAATIIHRDLKPDNVMLTSRAGQDDFVKVLDFGLAKTLAASGQQNLTAQGMVLGTPHYMAPESCTGHTVDHRADIYSFGVLLFQMLTGRVPFDDPYTGTVLVRHVNEPPPAPRGLNAEIPPSVEQIVLRCMAKAPEARFATMGELRLALLDPEAYLAGSPPVVPSSSPAVGAVSLPAPPAPAEAHNRTMLIAPPDGHDAAPSGRRWGLIIGLSGAAALAGAALVFALTDTAPEEPPPPPPVSRPMTLTPLDPVTGEPTSPAPVVIAGANDGTDAAPAPPAMTVTVLTTPSGAQVFDAEGTLLGVTPTDIELPRDGREHVLTFRHPETRAHQKRIRADGDTEIAIELDPRR